MQSQSTARVNTDIYVTDAANNSLRVLSVVRGNTVPIAGTPTVGSPASGTGAVSGALNFDDPDGDSLKYSLASQPVSSTITGIRSARSASRLGHPYLHAYARGARSGRATSAADNTATFTVLAEDPFGATKNVAVTVSVSPTPASPEIPVTVTAISIDTYPSAVAISGNDAYVYGGDVIWTIDTTTKTVTDWTALYDDPPAITPDGRKYVPNPNLYYQGNAPYDSVDVIDTATGTGHQEHPAPHLLRLRLRQPLRSPRRGDQSRRSARVRQRGLLGGNGHRHDRCDRDRYPQPTASHGYVPTSPLSDMEIAPDGTIYGASAEYPVVTVYNADMSQIGTVSLTSLGYYYWSPTTTLAFNGDEHPRLRRRAGLWRAVNTFR